MGKMTRNRQRKTVERIREREMTERGMPPPARLKGFKPASTGDMLRELVKGQSCRSPS